MRQWFKNPARLALVLLVLLFIGSCGTSAGTGTKTPQTEQELKAVWVATVYRLDYPSQATTNAAVLQQEADEILQNCAALGMNAVFLQVRPSADALYPSTLFPWSRYLTGSQTAAPSGGFDPLAYWVERAHALAKPGDVVILSPASASFDRFKNFEERGSAFKELVNTLK